MVYLCNVLHVVQLHTLPVIALIKKKDNPDKKNAAYLYAVSNVAECDVSDSYAYHAFNHMILDNGCQQNVAGNTWANNFIETLD